MGGHHHGGRGFRGGYGWGPPVIIEEYIDPNSDEYFVGKTLAFALGTPAVPTVPVASPPTAPVATPIAPPADSPPVETTTSSAPQVVTTPSAPQVVTTIAAPPAKKDNLLPAGGALAGGVAGFMVGGPIGAIVGLAVGFLGGKAVSDHQAMPTVTAAVVTPPAAAVHGDSCWDSASGWSPHGDERMR